MKRVVITGIGLITPIGAGRQNFWNALTEGRSGIGPVKCFDTSAFSVHLGAEVRDFVPQTYFRRQAPETMGRGSQMAVAAARMALEDAGISANDYQPDRTGVCMGTTSGEPQFVERYNDIRKDSGLDSVPTSSPAGSPLSSVFAAPA